MLPPPPLMSFLSPAFTPAWSRLTAERVEPDITAALADAEARFAAIAAQDPAGVSYESVLGAFDEAAATLDRAWVRVQHLDAVSNSPALRAAHNAMLPKVTDFYTRIYLNEGLWKILQAYAATPAARALTGVRRRFLEETLEDFRDSGAGLKPGEKTELERLNTELSAATQKFSENVLDATNAWELTIVDEARLAGLPESARAAARQSFLGKNPAAAGQPGWRFTLHAPSYLPLMKYAKDDALRHEVWQAGMNIGRAAPHDNTVLIPQILALRQAKARLLGRTQFADLVLHRRMAKSGASALGFIEKLQARLAEVFAREQRELEQFKAAHSGQPAGLLEPWEAAYWAELRRQVELDFDEEQLRPYFSIEGVLSGLFRLVETLFAVRLTERPVVFLEPGSAQELPPGVVEVWHPEVKFYDLHDADGRHLGSFYADWHPRESKRGGAWMNFFETGGPRPGGRFAPHLGIIAGNLTAPIAGRPALAHPRRGVTTIFHEFGHLLHHLFGEVEVKSLNGVRVAWDFVELPSQIMENWVWERAGLDFRRAPPGDGRAAAGGTFPADARDAPLHGGDGDDAPAGLQQNGPRFAFARGGTRRGEAPTSTRGCARAWRVICRVIAPSRRRSCRASPIFFPSRWAMRRAIIPTNGRRCWMPTRSRGFKRRACSTPPPAAISAKKSSPAAMARRRRSYFAIFWAASPTPPPTSRGAACPRKLTPRARGIFSAVISAAGGRRRARRASGARVRAGH